MENIIKSLLKDKKLLFKLDNYLDSADVMFIDNKDLKKNWHSRGLKNKDIIKYKDMKNFNYVVFNTETKLIEIKILSTEILGLECCKYSRSISNYRLTLLPNSNNIIEYESNRFGDRSDVLVLDDIKIQKVNEIEFMIIFYKLKSRSNVTGEIYNTSKHEIIVNSNDFLNFLNKKKINKDTRPNAPKSVYLS